MVVDVLAGISIAAFAWTGWSTGSVYQIGHIVTLLISTVIARGMVVPVAFAMLEIEADDVDGATGRVFLACFAIVYGLFWWAVRRLTREMRDVDMRGPADQVAGILTGAARGAIFAVVIAVGYMAVIFGGDDARYAQFTEETKIGQFAARNDFLERPAASLAQQLDEAGTLDESQQEWDVYRDGDQRETDQRDRDRRRRRRSR